MIRKIRGCSGTADRLQSTFVAIPFYVACPSSTYDIHTSTGSAVIIEQRASEEVAGEHAANVEVANPAFDVTPAELVTGIVTEHGIFKPGELETALSR